ncbi:MAG TPA: hypothetical protein DDZ83_02540 [Nitrospinae bacterium]|nr:hypothetical protein [Nitrospinota bacterium]
MGDPGPGEPDPGQARNRAISLHFAASPGRRKMIKNLFILKKACSKFWADLFSIFTPAIYGSPSPPVDPSTVETPTVRSK